MKFVNVFPEAQIGEKHCPGNKSSLTLSITGLKELDLGSSLYFI